MGYLIGSIEGRVAVQHIEENMHSKNFTFKCHREDHDIYAVNHLTFHPTLGTFVTCGSDGTFNFWCALLASRNTRKRSSHSLTRWLLSPSIRL